MTSAYKSEHHLNMSTDLKRLTPAMLNERNARIWAEQKILLEQRISDPVLYDLAKRDMDFEAARGVPIKQQKTLEQTLADAAQVRSTVHAELSRKGGKAPKSDALQELILEIVLTHPNTSEKELLKMLAGEAGAGVVTSIDEPSEPLAGDTPCIHFIEDDGRSKTASVPGLKDRLSRAKAKIKNSR